MHLFEDSFNGMIAAKSAGMKCIIVPEPASFSRAAGLPPTKLSSLLDFDEAILEELVPCRKAGYQRIKKYHRLSFFCQKVYIWQLDKNHSINKTEQ